MTTVYCTSFSHFLAVIICAGFCLCTKLRKSFRLSMLYFMFFNTHLGLRTVMYSPFFITGIPGNVWETYVTFQALAKSGTCWKKRNRELRCHDGNGKKAKFLGPFCTNAFSKICVFVIIENASIDSHPHIHTTLLMRFRLSTLRFENALEVDQNENAYISCWCGRSTTHQNENNVQKYRRHVCW